MSSISQVIKKVRSLILEFCNRYIVVLQKYENDTQDKILRPDRKDYGAKHMWVIRINSWCSITWFGS